MKWQQKHTTLLIIATGFGLLYFLFHKNWLLIPVAICVIGFLIGKIGGYIHLGWMMLAKALGFINSRILLTVLFFLVLTPLALFMRLAGKGNFIRKKPAGTVFVQRRHIYTKADLQNPF